MSSSWIRPQWPAPSHVQTLITTRAGGVSRGPYGELIGVGGLNLGFGSGDEAEAVRENRARLRAALPAEPRWLRQQHGANVVQAETVDDATAADAACAVEPGVVVVVLIADCMPVLLTDRSGRCVAAAHAGWRGLAAGVLQNTVGAMRERLEDRRAELIAYLGPAIGPRHFEVGPEVLQAMKERLPRAERAFVAVAGGKYLADLPGLARQALQQVGVVAVTGGVDCTYSDPQRFFSHRRDRITGRHAALIWRTDGKLDLSV